VRPRDAGPIAFAGLWETWMGPNGEEMETAVIITTPAQGELARLHERMPVIVPPNAFDLWLDCSNVDHMTAATLFMPAPEGMLEAYEISPAVNHIANDGLNLIEPVAAQQPSVPPAPEPAASAPAKRARKKDERQQSLF
jgi:putative SOS response-associated peptidase YedK